MTLATPLVALPSLGEGLYAKLEYLHPSGSLKHRALPPFLRARQEAGQLRRGQRIAILSAGSAAISVAWTAAQLDHPAVVVLPMVATPQMIRLIRWLGAECHQLSDDQIPSFMKQLASDPNVYLLEQTEEAGLIDYYRPVTDEIFAQLPGAAAITVGIGSGLSITGIGRQVRDRGLACQVVGVEPEEAAVASGRPWAPHSIGGLAPPVPQPLLDKSVVSEIVTVPSREAWARARQVHRTIGLPLGPSSGATVAAALEMRSRGFSGPIVAVCACAIGDFLESAPD